MAVAVRPLRRADQARILAGHAQSVDFHRPWVWPPMDAAAFAAWYFATVIGPNVALVAVLAEDAIVGVVNLTQVSGGVLQSAYMGYYVMHRYRGRGLMTEALARALEYAFQELGLHRVEANVRPENAASIALLKRAGFCKEGFSPRYLFLDGAWRDHERWAAYRGDGS